MMTNPWTYHCVLLLFQIGVLALSFYRLHRARVILVEATRCLDDTRTTQIAAYEALNQIEDDRLKALETRR